MARRAEARRDLQLAWRHPFVLSGVRAGMTSHPSSSVLLPLSMLLDLVELDRILVLAAKGRPSCSKWVSPSPLPPGYKNYLC